MSNIEKQVEELKKLPEFDEHPLMVSYGLNEDEDESDEYLAKKRDAISKAMKNEMKLAEAAPKMRKNPEAENIDKIYKAAYLARKGGGSGRYGKEFEKAKKIALKALADMHQYAKIGG